MSDWISLKSHQGSKPMAMLPVTLVGPEGDIDRDAILDTGTELSIFPQDLLEALGVDFTNAEETEAVTGIGSGTYLLPKDVEQMFIECRWNGHVVLVTTYASPPGTDAICLGVHDFLAHFVVTFDAGSKRFRLEPSEPGCCSDFE